MKILLTAVNAKYIHSNPAVYSLRAYAGAEFEKYIEIAEYTINHRPEEILAGLYEKKPDVIAFSCYIWNWNMIQFLLEELPKVLPDCALWLGGPEVSFDALQILQKYPQLTGIMVGEGEETFRDLAGYYVNCNIGNTLAPSSQDQSVPQTLKSIAGLALRTGYTAHRGLMDLNRLPFLYEHLEPFENRIIYYESSRGCPYQCSYCLSSIDKKVRFRDIDVVKKELQYFLEQRVPQVKFVDRTFNCNHTHAKEIWQYILKNDNGVTNFHFEISADLLTDEELDLLSRMRPGLVQLEIGVQTANPDTIQEIHRNMNLDKLEDIVGRLHAGKNIHIHLDLIAGLPFEDYESFGLSFDRVYRMRPEQLQLGFLKVLKGSLMHEKAEEYGLLYGNRPPYEVLCTTWLPYADLLRLKRIEEMVELYYNSNQFTHTLAALQKHFKSPFAMFEALADFFREKGYFTNAPSRAYRYDVLLAFAENADPAGSQHYRELLTFDLYLRENVKSRPGFAKDLQVYKENIRSFYKQEEETRRYLPEYRAYDSRQLSKMTHLEPLEFPLWEKHYILFDYQARSPLTKEARIVVLRQEEDGDFFEVIRENFYDGLLCQSGSGDDRTES